MQKLTKEQADSLIKQIDANVQHRVVTTLKINEASDVIAQIRVFVTQAINQCTEKEFPEIFMRPIHAEHDEEIRVFNALCDSFDDCISVYSKNEYTHLRPAQFKQFTEGCQKICEWLEEKS